MAMVSNSRGKQNQHPIRLKGLRQAVYTLNKLELGGTSQIIEDFDGDEQLIKMWISFLLHNHWIEEKELGQIVVTEKGRQWGKRLLVEYAVVS